MIREFFYHKHELIEEIKTEGNGHTDQKIIKTDEILKPDRAGVILEEDALGRNEYRKYRVDYRVIKTGTFAGTYDEHEIELEQEHLQIIDGFKMIPEKNFETGDHFFKEENGEIIELELTDYQLTNVWAAFSYNWKITMLEFERKNEIKLKEIELFLYQEKGPLIEIIVADEGTYPINGPAGGFWWVKGIEYTLPAPELISPEINFKALEAIPEFEIKIKKREEGDSRKYHARIRIAQRSDMRNSNFVFESKEDQEGWQFYNEGTDEWEPFPQEGVNPETRVKYQPDISPDFGFYYWDAAAWHEEFKYGLDAISRAIIIIVETDQVYELTIRGIPYRATGLEIIESANGEIGSIRIQLINENI